MTDVSENNTPIIILGMHRSGTSMITRMLESLGLFVGKEQEENSEAIFFLKLNNWLLKQSGGAWDNPKPFHYLLDFPRLRELSQDYLTLSLSTPRVISYLGWRHYMSSRKLEHLSFPWGWKDPRNTYTLPIWLDLFPQAKIVHIYRHGVDVSQSLVKRQGQRLAEGEKRYAKRRFLYQVVHKRGGFTHSARCYSREHAFSLWEDYVCEAQRHVASLGDRAYEVKFEDFLADAPTYLAELARFCQLDVSEEHINAVAQNAKPSRSQAYASDPELLAFSQSVSERLGRYGYK
jgi:hypothetical protein